MSLKKIELIKTILALCMLHTPALVLSADCQIAISRPVINYYQIRRDDILTSSGDGLSIHEQYATVNIHCSDKEKFAVLLQNTAGESGFIKFGRYGALKIKVSNMILDGKSYNIAISKNMSRFDFVSDGSPEVSLDTNDIIVASENGAVPAGKQMNFTVTVSPVLKDESFKNHADTEKLESELSWRIFSLK